MIRAVIDTNVWVAGLLSDSDPPSRIVDLALGGLIIPVVSPAILNELNEVLPRLELALPRAEVKQIVAYLTVPGTHVASVDPVQPERVCADPDDDIFAAAALDGQAAFLITGNVKHFPRSPWRGIQIADPATFLRLTGLDAA